MAAAVNGTVVVELSEIKARGGGGFGDGHGGGTRTCNGGGGVGGRGWSPSLIFLEQPLEMEFTPSFFLNDD